MHFFYTKVQRRIKTSLHLDNISRHKRRPLPSHKHATLCHTVVGQAAQRLLMPVLDSHSGTETKVILPGLCPLAFHLLHSSFFLPDSPEKDVSGSKAHSGKARRARLPECGWKWLQYDDRRRLIPAHGPSLGAKLKRDGVFGSRRNMETCNAALSVALFHCQQVFNTENTYKHHNNPGNMFHCTEPCVGCLSAWMSDLQMSDRCEIWATWS